MEQRNSSKIEIKERRAVVRVVEKPWGRELWWAVTPAYVGKILEVKAGQRLSLQYHKEKLESMYFVSGSGQFVYGEQVLTIEPGLAVTIEPGTVHRIIATSDVTVFEVSTPQVEDVVRIEDAYGRSPSQAQPV
ncbi:MAG: cupin domain-containing protein [Firmicutes bacterium]|nr:cupin domain-containing protein [Bacillota bacterium]